MGVHHDPYDLSHVFARNCRNRGRLSAAWTHLPMVGAPLADFASRAAREIVTQRGGATPRSSGPGQPDHRNGPDGDTQQRRLATRNGAAARSVLPAPDDDAEEIQMEDDTPRRRTR
jgi:hypothetical protein